MKLLPDSTPAHASAIILLVAAWIFSPGLPADQSAQKGLTWGKLRHLNDLQIDFVGCGGCDAYHGDTSCLEARPILCLKVDHSPRPPYEITGSAHAMPKEYYEGWAGGTIALTAPVIGTTLQSPSNADDICSAQLGAGYRMAEFHDGHGGWNFWAFGNIPDNSRFWVAINDQPANCWGQVAAPARVTAPAQVKAPDFVAAPDHPSKSASVFKCRGADGVITLTDQPCAGGARDSDGPSIDADDDR